MKSNIKFYFIALITMMLISCANTTSPNEIMEYEINDILQDVATDFNFAQLDSLMTNFLPSFSHKDRDFDEEKQFWQDLIYQYNEVSIDNISINKISNDRLVASFDIKFKNASTTQIYNEPSGEFGDLSYFARENGEWKIIGKDKW